ncbi:MAG: hypothetical protein JWQ11_4177, partial [Rhizobacter sp.]|nr:hypothetical protein [Rhizobacter sp.]
MNINNASVAVKLWSTIILLLVATCGIEGATLYKSSGLEKKSAQALAGVRLNVNRAYQWKGMTDTAVSRKMAAAVTEDSRVGELFKDTDVSDSAKITEIRTALAEAGQSNEEMTLMKDISARAKVLIAAGDKAAEARRLGDLKGAAEFIKNDYRQAFANYLAGIDVFVQLQLDKERQVISDAENTRATLTIVRLIGALVILCIGAAAAFLLSRMIRRPLQTSIEMARSIAAGDLTRQISDDRKDEFGEMMQALSAMQGKLSGIVSEVRENAEGVATASAQIAQGNNDLSGRTEQQASALEETAASMEQLSSTVRQNADNSRQANTLAQGASSVAVRGGEVVSEVVQTMKDINASSKKITDIIAVIDGIAFQTNILALNAAVEAARAGEQGRGFAVVASEVRSLAQRSAEAAKEIKTLISASVERVDRGTALVDQAGVTMQEVVASIRRVTDIVGEISSASTEQSAGVAQIGEAVTQMDQATQQNAALVEESAAAAESLKIQARQLVDVMAVFTVTAGVVFERPMAAPAPAASLPRHAFSLAKPAERRAVGRAADVTRLPGRPAAAAAS